MPGASLRARAAALADRLSKERSRHRRLIITIQVVLGVAGFGYILYGLICAVHDGAAASPGSLVAAIAVLVPLRLLALSATSFRWRAWLMLGGSGDVTMKWALYVNAVANFFGAITFGTPARDAYRAGTSVASGQTVQRSIAATLLDSMSGAATQGVLAAALVLALTTGVAALPVAICAVFAGAIWWLPFGLTSSRYPQGDGRIQRLERSVRTFVRMAGRRPLARTLTISVLVTLVRVGAFAAGVFLATRILGFPVGIDDALVIGLIQSAVQFVPWVLQGIGLHDASLFGALALVGVPAPTAVGVTVAVRAALLVTALVGGLWYLGARGRSRERGALL